MTDSNETEEETKFAGQLDNPWAGVIVSVWITLTIVSVVILMLVGMWTIIT